MKLILSNRLVMVCFPILVIFIWVAMLVYGRSSGTLVTMPVRGFDPRDILAGQYLLVRVDYGENADCQTAFKERDCSERNLSRKDRRRCYDRYDTPAFFCVETKKFVDDKSLCRGAAIKGYCQWNRFEDNISRFYIPEGQARALETAVRNAKNEPKLQLSVSKDGHARPVDLILDGKPWREWVKTNRN